MVGEVLRKIKEVNMQDKMLKSIIGNDLTSVFNTVFNLASKPFEN